MPRPSDALARTKCVEGWAEARCAGSWVPRYVQIQTWSPELPHNLKYCPVPNLKLSRLLADSPHQEWKNTGPTPALSAPGRRTAKSRLPAAANLPPSERQFPCSLLSLLLQPHSGPPVLKIPSRTGRREISSQRPPPLPPSPYPLFFIFVCLFSFSVLSFSSVFFPSKFYLPLRRYGDNCFMSCPCFPFPSLV